MPFNQPDCQQLQLTDVRSQPNVQVAQSVFREVHKHSQRWLRIIDTSLVASNYTHQEQSVQEFKLFRWLQILESSLGAQKRPLLFKAVLGFIGSCRVVELYIPVHLGRSITNSQIYEVKIKDASVSGRSAAFVLQG
jgi:hypothetical protein